MTMTFLRTSPLLAATLAATIGIAHAQTPQVAADPHHPAATSPAATAPAAPTPVPGGMPMNAPSTDGMMTGDMSKMMQSMMPMMRAMMAGAGMAQMQDRMGMMAPKHIEGRIAFLRTEIGITEAQMPQWAAVAEALRQNAKAMMSTHARMMAGGEPTSAPQRLERHITAMTAHLDAARASLPAVQALYAVLTEAQRKVADTMLVPPMGQM